MKCRVYKIGQAILRTAVLFLAAWMAPSLVWAQSPPEAGPPSAEKQDLALEWGRDPFALPPSSGGTGAKGDGEFLLSAIIFHPGGGAAIINNKILRQGDMIEGRRIMTILKDRVVLRGAAGEKELLVNKGPAAQKTQRRLAP